MKARGKILAAFRKQALVEIRESLRTADAQGAELATKVRAAWSK